MDGWRLTNANGARALDYIGKASGCWVIKMPGGEPTISLLFRIFNTVFTLHKSNLTEKIELVFLFCFFPLFWSRLSEYRNCQSYDMQFEFSRQKLENWIFQTYFSKKCHFFRHSSKNITNITFWRENTNSLWNVRKLIFGGKIQHGFCIS